MHIRLFLNKNWKDVRTGGLSPGNSYLYGRYVHGTEEAQDFCIIVGSLTFALPEEVHEYVGRVTLTDSFRKMHAYGDVAWEGDVHGYAKVNKGQHDLELEGPSFAQVKEAYLKIRTGELPPTKILDGISRMPEDLLAAKVESLEYRIDEISARLAHLYDPIHEWTEIKRAQASEALELLRNMVNRQPTLRSARDLAWRLLDRLN